MQATHDISIAGHFGELIQGRMGPNGDVALISLPCPKLHVRLSHKTGPFAFTQTPQDILNTDDIDALFHALSAEKSGAFHLTHDMPAGGGAGASTAARVAVIKALSPDLLPEDIARICFQTEGAVDPLMYPNADHMLWASRTGAVHTMFSPLPEGDLIGGFLDKSERTDARDANFADITDLIAKWPDIRTLHDMAQLTTLSAQRNHKTRGHHDDPTFDIAQEIGALGVVVAHTGSARGFLFDRGGIPEDAQAILTASGLRGLCQFSFGGPS
ncbi:MAG: propanediol utilization protein [Halocynthiibacter sp.]